jgi:hypothetical protein
MSEMRGHIMGAITLRDVEVIIPHPSEGPEAKPVVLMEEEGETLVACAKCNMCLEEALTLDCPGLPIESMFDDPEEIK